MENQRNVIRVPIIETAQTSSVVHIQRNQNDSRALGHKSQSTAEQESGQIAALRGLDISNLCRANRYRQASVELRIQDRKIVLSGESAKVT